MLEYCIYQQTILVGGLHGQLMQARSVAERLKQYDIQNVYISPFYRCAVPAALLAPSPSAAGLAVPHVVDTAPRLKPALHCRCIQTARLCTEGLKIPPERWTVSVAVCEVCAWACAVACRQCREPGS